MFNFLSKANSGNSRVADISSGSASKTNGVTPANHDVEIVDVDREVLERRQRSTARHLYFKNSLRIDISKLPTNAKERRNGFDCPLSCQQVVIWINTATTLASTIAWLILPSIEYLNAAESGSTAQYLHSAIFSLLALAFSTSLLLTVRWGYICTASVPTDVLVQKQREEKVFKETFKPVWFDTRQPIDHYCIICEAYVQERTKHCGPCNRCCEEFDHHCQWLNNCIGMSNYKNFRRLIMAYFFYSFTSVLMFAHAQAMQIVGESESGSAVSEPFLWVQAGLNILAMLFDMQLVWFHRWLDSKDISTFDYITYKREHEEIKKQLKTGEVDQVEYDDWVMRQTPKTIKKKSKTIVKRHHSETAQKLEVAANDPNSRDDEIIEEDFRDQSRTVLEGAGIEASSDLVLQEGNSDKAPSFQQSSVIDITACDGKPRSIIQQTCDIQNELGAKKIDTQQSDPDVLLSSNSEMKKLEKRPTEVRVTRMGTLQMTQGNISSGRRIENLSQHVLSPKSTDPPITPMSPVSRVQIEAPVTPQKKTLNHSVERKTCCASVTCLPCIQSTRSSQAMQQAMPGHLRPLSKPREPVQDYQVAVSALSLAQKQQRECTSSAIDFLGHTSSVAPPAGTASVSSARRHRAQSSCDLVMTHIANVEGQHSEDDSLQDQRKKNLLALKQKQIEEANLSSGVRNKGVPTQGTVDFALRHQYEHMRFDTADFTDSMVVKDDIAHQKQEKRCSGERLRIKAPEQLKDSRTIEPQSPILGTPEQRPVQEARENTTSGAGGSSSCLFPPIENNRRNQGGSGTHLKF